MARAVHAPQRMRRNVRVSAFGGAVIRPASLSSGAEASADDGRVRTMFVNARYDWNEPLSAKAYLSWRGQLARRHDAVLVKGGPEARDRRYIVRTDTDASSLRTASLTLRAISICGRSKGPLNSAARVKCRSVRRTNRPPRRRGTRRLRQPHRGPYRKNRRGNCVLKMPCTCWPH
ncbi:MAG: hypothetical protein QM757_40615 [Paludibaculum sp.]